LPFRLAILAWEYPPRIVGEMAHHVHRLVTELVTGDFHVSVITAGDGYPGHEQVSERLEVYRVPHPLGSHPTIVTWALSLSSEIQRMVADLWYGRPERLDLLHIHEWQFVPAALGLVKTFPLPLALTLHSLEDHRTGDPSAPLSSCIRSLERLGTQESRVVITQSDWMKREVERVHEVSPTKVRVVRPESPQWVDEVADSYQAALLRAAGDRS
jgi:hypothetical protein